jgi:hypothetical protein
MYLGNLFFTLETDCTAGTPVNYNIYPNNMCATPLANITADQLDSCTESGSDSFIMQCNAAATPAVDSPSVTAPQSSPLSAPGAATPVTPNNTPVKKSSAHSLGVSVGVVFGLVARYFLL